ncbi:MAG: hypothetical protein FWD27_05080 [Coriobacteriia bacterium]|nr:hypothetical protein [Coriobacteriia bacterium]
MATDKKVTRVESNAEAPATRDWKPTPEAKSKATMFRIIAAILWALAIGAEAFLIFGMLLQTAFLEFNMVILIIGLVVIAGLAIGGNLLWKKANKLDPAKKADTVRFFIQNQLGLIITIIAFLPLIVLIFLNKDMDGKQKGIVAAIAIALFLVAGWTGLSLNSPSVEQYSDETARVQNLTGQDFVYWTKSGTKYHLFDNCQYLKGDRTDELFEGRVGTAFAEISRLDTEKPLCSACENRYVKENPGATTGADSVNASGAGADDGTDEDNEDDGNDNIDDVDDYNDDEEDEE